MRNIFASGPTSGHEVGLVPFAPMRYALPALSTAQIILVGYALLLVVGGLIGYRKAGSRPSLIAGTISGLVALVAAGLMIFDARAIWLGVALAVAMLVVFSIRFSKTGKFMPSGMLGIISLGVLVGLILAIL